MTHFACKKSLINQGPSEWFGSTQGLFWSSGSVSLTNHSEIKQTAKPYAVRLSQVVANHLEITSVKWLSEWLYKPLTSVNRMKKKSLEFRKAVHFNLVYLHGKTS